MKKAFDMYYSESDNLITSSPSDRNDIVLMDRAIARSYAPSGRGWLDDAAFQIRTGLDARRLAGLIRRYERLNVVDRHEPSECPHGHIFDPGATECPDCHEPASNARLSGLTRYWVLKQPQEPLFDPTTARRPFNVFISYRHGETGQLAADLYYGLVSRNLNVFLDSSIIPPGVSFERIFLPVASDTSHFVFLASDSYFDSTYCKAELAHALRTARNVIPVPIGGNFHPPNDMPWLNQMNPCLIIGDGQCLSKELEDYLLPVVTQNPAPTNCDHRLNACIYLLQQMGRNELLSRFATSNWLSDIINQGTGPQHWIVAIRQEVGNNTTRLNELCSTLAP